MSLTPGTKLAHYEILEPIGKGGMGEVFRAKDTKLGRDVALKILPDAFAEDDEGLARFQREAKVLASLSHPNIAAIYGLEESERTHYLVLELVEGETLADRIARGRIPFDEARDIAIRIAEALEEAHERGVVHRDLKPANVKLTPDEKVKVLDFGLAKALVDETPEADDSMSPTLTRDATRIGVILGTAAYMSPEQARGKRVDRRSDIFAFGAVLYEMLAGRKAFAGEDISEILAAVIKSEPHWDAFAPSTPTRARVLVRKCLRKKLSRRLQHIGDARIELEDIDASQTEPADTKDSVWRRVQAGVTFVVGLAVGLAAFLLYEPSPPMEDLVLTQLTANPFEDTVLSASISPDGKYLAFASLSGLTVRLMETGETHPVVLPDDLTVNAVDWFPDASTLLLEDATGLWRASIFGGTPRRIASAAYEASISAEGNIAYLSSAEWPTREIIVAGPDGENARVLVKASGAESFWELAWSPDAEWLLFGVWDRRMSIQAIHVDTGERALVLEDPGLFQNWRGNLPFAWTPDGKLLYGLREKAPNGESSNLWSTPIDSGARVSGEPSRLTHLVDANVKDLSQTRDGTRLVFLSERNQADVFVGELPDAIDDSRRLTIDERNDYPDGWITGDGELSILFHSNRTGAWKIFRQAMNEKAPLLVSSGHAADVSPDGRWIFSESGTEWTRTSVSGGPGETLGPAHALQCNVGEAPRCLVGERDYTSGQYVFYAFEPMEGRGNEVLRIADKPPFANWDISPDGSRVAVVHNDGRIRIVNLEGGEERVLDLDGWSFGEYVAFASDGQSVFVDGSRSGYRATDRKSLLRVSLEEVPSVRELRYRRNGWHVNPQASPDGRYLAFAAMTFSANAWLLENF